MKTISGNGLNQPYGVAIDSAGNVWVANSGANSVLEFNGAGTLLTTIGGSGIFNGPQGVTVDPSGNVWVSDSNNVTNNRLLEYTQTIPGDANLDGRVNINDLTIVLANYNLTGQTWTQGSMDGDPTGTVNINDLTIVLANYGDTVAASGGGLAATPEPGTLLLVAVGVTSLLTCAWWRQAHRITASRQNRDLHYDGQPARKCRLPAFAFHGGQKPSATARPARARRTALPVSLTSNF